MEQEARQSKEQLAEMALTATEYSNMIQKKEERISILTDQLEASKQQQESASKEMIELQSDLDTLTAELEAEKQDRVLGATARAKLQEELDELRALMVAKTDEESRRNEAEKSKEVELADLRAQCQKLQLDLTEARHLTLETQSKLKLELDYASRELASLQDAHNSVLARERSTQAQLLEAQTALSDLENINAQWNQNYSQLALVNVILKPN